jgi:hypothetical protein
MAAMTEFHDPPANAFLTLLAEELSHRGIQATVTGRGISSALTFDDATVAKEFGAVYYHQPLSGRSTFIWRSGGELGPVGEIKAAATKIEKAVTSNERPAPPRM